MATHATRNGDYIDTGRVHTYYEVNGSGEPLILLHGGMCTAETFDGQTPALAEHFRVDLSEPRRYSGRAHDQAQTTVPKFEERAAEEYSEG